MGYRILKPVRNNPIRTEKVICVAKSTISISPGFAMAAKVNVGTTVLFLLNDDGRLLLDFKQGEFKDAFPIRIYNTSAKAGLFYKVNMKRAIEHYGIPRGRFHVTGNDGVLWETDCFIPNKKTTE